MNFSNYTYSWVKHAVYREESMFQTHCGNYAAFERMNAKEVAVIHTSWCYTVCLWWNLTSIIQGTKTHYVPWTKWLGVCVCMYLGVIIQQRTFSTVCIHIIYCELGKIQPAIYFIHLWAHTAYICMHLIVFQWNSWTQWPPTVLHNAVVKLSNSFTLLLGCSTHTGQIQDTCRH